ncbi:MAG: FkbM family methyltransferase [Deltaproteobacteria bacterium]|nr:FkbM family methyltransferase [Deltaproteobacteria bacterium]
MIIKSIKKLLFPPKKISYALNQLDVKLLPYIDFPNGFFIEVGANDGISQSNTLYFERYKGWKGLLIEAIPGLAEKCRQNRPKCIVENCALVAAAYPEKTVEMRYCNLMSLVKGSLNSDEDEKKRILSGMQHLAKDEKTYIVKVPAKTLSEVLNKHSIEHIDLLSLDVEGYESQVLKGIDFNKQRIEFMLIEARDREDIEAVISHLYKPIAILNTTESYSDILYRRR